MMYDSLKILASQISEENKLWHNKNAHNVPCWLLMQQLLLGQPIPQDTHTHGSKLMYQQPLALGVVDCSKIWITSKG